MKSVQRFEKLEDLILAVKEIGETTKNAWIFIEDTVKVPKEVATIFTTPIGCGEKNVWSILCNLTEKEHSITFNTAKDPDRVVFFGMKK